MSKGIKFKNRNNEFIYPCSFYPIDSIYLSLSDVNPSTYFGGTWKMIKDKFMLGAGGKYTTGSTAGNEIHNHSLSSKGGANMRKYADTFYQGDTTTAGTMPKETSGYWWLTTANSDYSSTTNPGTKCVGVGLYGATDDKSSMPPYFAVYIWRRIA